MSHGSNHGSTVAPLPIAEPTNTARPPRNRGKLVMGAFAVAAALSLGGYAFTRRGLESTDDAQLDAEIVAVPALVSGTVASVHFKENDRVEAGTLLVELDDAIPRAKLAQAEAKLLVAQADQAEAEVEVELSGSRASGNRSIAAAGLKSANVGVATYPEQIAASEAQVRVAEANLAQARSDREAFDALFARGTIARAQRDQGVIANDRAQSELDAARARLATLRLSANEARSQVSAASAKLEQSDHVSALARQAEARAEAARANVASARALRDLAALELSYTKIRAPRAGIVSKKSVSTGEAVSMNQSVVQLVTPELWVNANFKETQVGKMRVGQRVSFEVDAVPGKELHGRVESFSGATGARFTLLPPDNASGNYVKVVQRVPVRIHVDDAVAQFGIVPGMSVELTVDTRSGG